MDEQELRAMVRASIARHAAAGQGNLPADPQYRGAEASFMRLTALRGGDEDGACLIEPTVRCNHCGYCQSYGH